MADVVPSVETASGGLRRQAETGDRLTSVSGGRVDAGPLNNYTATAAPGVGDDSDDGYEVGSFWHDVTNDNSYVCGDATVGAAVWTEITDAGGGGGGGKPTDSTWGVNVQTLTTDITLTDSDDTIQALSQDGSGPYNVTLPAITTSTPHFEIWNVHSSDNLTILNGKSQQVTILTPGEVLKLVTDGTSSYYAKIATDAAAGPSVGQIIYIFTALQFLSTDHNMTAWGGYGRNSTANDDVETECAMVAAATITKITHDFAAASSTVMALRKNGAADTTFDAQSTTQDELQVSSADPSISVAAGDHISMRYVSGTAPNFRAHLQVYAEPTSTTESYAILNYGGGTPIAGRYLCANGLNQTMRTTLDYAAEHTMPSAVSVSNVWWQVTAASPDVDMVMWKNGASSSTWTLDAQAGTASFTAIALAQGDTLAVESDAITTTWSTYAQLFFRVDGAADSWLNTGGYMLSTKRLIPSMSAFGSPVTTTSQIIMPWAGRLQDYAFSRDITTSWTIGVYKNGALDQTSAASTADQAAESFTNETTFAALDYLRFEVTVSGSPRVASCIFRLKKD